MRGGGAATGMRTVQRAGGTSRGQIPPENGLRRNGGVMNTMGLLQKHLPVRKRRRMNWISILGLANSPRTTAVRLAALNGRPRRLSIRPMTLLQKTALEGRLVTPRAQPSRSGQHGRRRESWRSCMQKRYEGSTLRNTALSRTATTAKSKTRLLLVTSRTPLIPRSGPTTPRRKESIA